MQWYLSPDGSHGWAGAPATIGSYISDDDYPIEALLKHKQGVVHFRVTIGTNGRVSRCEVTGSSDSPLLDEATCRIVSERARFAPARDSNGNPIEVQREEAVRWTLPNL
jgi:protein TonB